MFFEALEPRQLMSVDPQDDTIIWEGNTLPQQHALVSTTDALLTAPTSGDKKAIGLNYLTQNAAALDLEAGDFQYSIITDQYTSNGITHIYLQQTFNGLRITDSHAAVHVGSNGQVIAANSSFIPDLPHPTVNTNPSPGFIAREALVLFAEQVGLDGMTPITVISESNGPDRATVLSAPELSDDLIKARLQYVPDGQGGVILGWNFNFLTKDRTHWWDGTISADLMSSSKIVHLSDWISNASYNVFARPVEDPLDGNRSIVVDPHDANFASPLGWHDANGVDGPEFLDTRGNRVSAQHDRNGDDQDEGGTRPTSPTLDFDSPLDTTQHPFTYTDATTTNVFYWGNLTLDVAANHGFDEVSGNFQQVNFTGQGLGNDDVLADTQDPFATNNAFFGTPPDGINGFTAYGLVTVSFSTGAVLVPPRDIGLDGTVVAHEFGHGISNRLTGGPANANALNALQSGGMGEGWSDWLGLVLTAEAGDTPDMPRPIGEWATDTPGTGIRRYPYSFDMSIDPLTLGAFNGGFPANEVHAAGEIWASALWDMTQLLVQKHGFDPDLYQGFGGLQVALDIVLEGMKLQPANPTFTEARDAILAADLALYRGENFDEIWEAFARRGFGLSAKSFPFQFTGNSNSEVVVEAFDRPTPLARVSGTVYQDVNFNANRDTVDVPLAGWTVYVDSNNNAQLDAGERRTTSAADGSYSMSFFGRGSARIRQVLQNGYTQVEPSNNAPYVISIPDRGVVLGGADFGNRQLPGTVSGIKWNDLDADGVMDLDDPATVGVNEAEPGMPGIVIYCDLNNDGRIGILEPAAITDVNGRYKIQNIQPGTTYTIRELNSPGTVQTFPDPSAPEAGAYVNVTVLRGADTPDINFGNTTAIDFGDAPTAALSGFAASYPVTLAQNGARHGVLPGFSLGAAVDGEPDGQPAANALGDDIANVPDDEDGVVVPGLTPGQTVNAMVTVQNGGFSAGLLQGWVDWNRDGDWDDAGERVVEDLLLREQAAPHLVPITVPAGTALGPTYARFRYGYEFDMGPTGPASAGEVEDHLVVILDVLPVAVPDCFGGGGTIPGCAPVIIKQGSANNPLDVLANDFGTINGGPFLHQADFPVFTTGGGVVNYQSDTGALLYTPEPNFIGVDTFNYRIKDGDVPPNFSSPAPNTTVTIHVTAKDPRAIDDTRTVAFSATPTLTRLPAPNLTANDFSPDVANTRITAIQRVSPGPLPAGELAQISADGQSIDFRPGTNFRGTVIYNYTIDDLDPLTASSTAQVTIQVVDVVAGVPQPAPSHLAQLEVQYLDLAGNPITAIGTNQEFIVRVVATDIAPDDLDGAGPFVPRNQKGVEGAYLDLLYNQALAAPVLSNSNPLGFVVTFDGKLQSQATGGTIITTNSVQNVPSPPTATSFSGDTNLDIADDAYNGLNLVFTSGSLVGQRARILDYDGANRRLIFEAGSFTGAPSVGSAFTIAAPLYNQNQTGELNFPAPGVIDEFGGFHLDPVPPNHSAGAGPNTVFSARFRAGSTAGSFSAIGDPADLNGPGQDSRVVIVNTPNPAPNEDIILTDEQVFLKSPAPLTITDGAGEFSNFRNSLDVNDDRAVSPIDALLVINDLNSNEPRPISQYSLAAGGQLPGGYLDVNLDRFVSPIDALLVINFLNAASGQSSSALPEGESAFSVAADEAEGESADSGAGLGAQMAAALLSSAGDSGTEATFETTAQEDLCELPLPEALASLFNDLAGDIHSLLSSESESGLDLEAIRSLATSAVDELFAQLDCHGLLGGNSLCDDESSQG